MNPSLNCRTGRKKSAQPSWSTCQVKRSSANSDAQSDGGCRRSRLPDLSFSYLPHMLSKLGLREFRNCPIAVVPKALWCHLRRGLGQCGSSTQPADGLSSRPNKQHDRARSIRMYDLRDQQGCDPELVRKSITVPPWTNRMEGPGNSTGLGTETSAARWLYRSSAAPVTINPVNP